MRTQFFCTRWGSEDLSTDAFFNKAKQQGYDGIEIGLPAHTSVKELDDIWFVATKYNMPVIAQHYDTYTADYTRHCDAYAAWFEKIKPYQPIFVNTQTGKDFFSFEQNSLIVAIATAFTVQTSIPVYHETHRNKFPFAAHITRDYLQRIPGLKITLDASHWVCVAESFLEDQQESMELAIERTEHIHARIGYPEGPQVPDPRVEEWQHALQVHLNWWDKIAARKKQEDENAILTITPEFGPFPYMVGLPFTKQPITNQWEVNAFMLKLLKERYAYQ